MNKKIIDKFKKDNGADFHLRNWRNNGPEQDDFEYFISKAVEYGYENSKHILEGIARQAISNDIGMSAAAIVDRYINKNNSKHTSYPHDGSDFGRCYRLIQETGIDIKIMTGVSDKWDLIVFNWDELIQVYLKGQPLGAMIGRILK